jgi:cytochrome c-type protein NapC
MNRLSISIWGLSLLLFCALGLALLGAAGFERTNSQAFCVSCHSMSTVATEHADSAHYRNASGVMASCADCHVPRALMPALLAKVAASKDVWHELLGTIDTPEKFEAQRWRLANAVWRKMAANDSRECRNCHSFAQMDLEAQAPRTARRHERAAANSRTCIDCHKGIAHRLPEPPTP